MLNSSPSLSLLSLFFPSLSFAFPICVFLFWGAKAFSFYVQTLAQ